MDGGTVELDGHGAPTNPAARRHLGVAPQSLALYDDLSGEENLAFFASLHALGGAALKDRVAWALSFVGLSDRRKDRVKTYSGGRARGPPRGRTGSICTEAPGSLSRALKSSSGRSACGGGWRGS